MDTGVITWFADGKLNVSYNCLDRHVEAGRVAFHWIGEEGGQRDVTYGELHCGGPPHRTASSGTSEFEMGEAR